MSRSWESSKPLFSSTGYISTPTREIAHPSEITTFVQDTQLSASQLETVQNHQQSLPKCQVSKCFKPQPNSILHKCRSIHSSGRMSTNLVAGTRRTTTQRPPFIFDRPLQQPSCTQNSPVPPYNLRAPRRPLHHQVSSIPRAAGHLRNPFHTHRPEPVPATHGVRPRTAPPGETGVCSAVSGPIIDGTYSRLRLVSGFNGDRCD